jgi:hypothetical protein
MPQRNLLPYTAVVCAVEVLDRSLINTVLSKPALSQKAVIRAIHLSTTAHGASSFPYNKSA